MFFDLLDRRIYSCMHRHTVVRLCMHPCLIYKDCPCCICCGKSACVHLKVCMYALSCMWCCTHVHIAPVYLCTDTHGSWATVFLFLEGGDILPVCVFISRDILPPEHLMPRLFCIAPLSLPLLLFLLSCLCALCSTSSSHFDGDMSVSCSGELAWHPSSLQLPLGLWTRLAEVNWRAEQTAWKETVCRSNWRQHGTTVCTLTVLIIATLGTITGC